MRISDWSSDVCSSDLSRMPTLISTVETFWVITGPILKIFHVKTSGLDYSDRQHRHEAVLDALKARDPEAATTAIQADLTWGGNIMIDWLAEREAEPAQTRSAERRVGKVSVSPGRYRWAQNQK